MAVKRIPLKPLKVAQAEKNIMSASLRHGRNIGKQFGKITRSWEGETPTFPAVQEVTGGDLVTTVEATGSELAIKKMGWLDDGTPPHQITAKKAPALAFATGYKRKTTVRVIGSQSGGSFGPKVRAQTVNHPGTEEGAFAETIEQQEGPKFQKDIEKVATNL